MKTKFQILRNDAIKSITELYLNVEPLRHPQNFNKGGFRKGDLIYFPKDLSIIERVWENGVCAHFIKVGVQRNGDMFTTFISLSSFEKMPYHRGQVPHALMEFDYVVDMLKALQGAKVEVNDVSQMEFDFKTKDGKIVHSSRPIYTLDFA